MLFTFDDQDLIDTVRAEARGRFWNYEERHGMLVPLDGEVAWLLSEEEKPYWRGHITDLDYELAR
jgi:hypothetical protein